jgi:hypothetical protein
MKKQKKSSTVRVKAIPTPRLSSSNVSISQETVEHMKQCEARDWMRRRKIKIGEVGSENAQLWWVGVKNDIKKRRGDSGLVDLVRRMETERNATKTTVPSKRVDAKQQKRKALGSNALSQEEVQGGLFLPD